MDGRYESAILCSVIGLFLCTQTGVAQTQIPPDSPFTTPAPEPEVSSEIVIETEPESEPINPYAGDLLTRSRLTGDWWGHRSALVERGVTFDFFATQFYQGVASGGRNQDWEYGGKLDYLMNVDGGKLGLWQGLLVNLHAETRYGTDVNNIDGLLAPANLPMSFPAPDQNITSITGLKITQALSENFAVYLGKINTLDEFPLRFSPGMGTNRPGLGGFQNASLVFNSIVGRTVPYSTVGVGAAAMQGEQVVLSITAFDPEERATRGVDDPYARGVVLVPDLLLRTHLFDHPGIYNFGSVYSTAKYRSFDPAAYLSIPPALVRDARFTPLETGSWALYANCYQSLWVDPSDEKRTWGFFFNLGLSDGNPNPIRYTACAGVAGRSMLPSRTLDTFGVGYFHLGLSENFKQLSQFVLPQRDESGVELFYNCALAPWARLTYDLQIARPSTVRFDTTVITGLRFQLLF